MIRLCCTHVWNPCSGHAAFNALSSTQRRIPYTVVRGMSDWVHTPLLNKGSGMWAAAPAVEDFAEGYK
jgi:hypothetical protein